MENIISLNSNFFLETKFKNTIRCIVLGNNQDGCLLTGDKIDCKDFKKVDLEIPYPNIEENYVCRNNKFKIRTGMNSCGVVRENSVFIWGKLKDESNIEKVFNSNQLSFDNYKFSDEIEDLKIGDIHSLILINEKVFSFGSNQHGALGIIDKNQENKENEENFKTPREIFFPANIKIRKIYAGVRTSFLIDVTGGVYCFGCNRFNELGLIGKDNIKETNLLSIIYTPSFNKNLANFYIKSISTGLKHTIFISKEKNIFGCGDNQKGYLGFDNSKFSQLIIKNKCILTRLDELWQINPHEIKKVSCGWNNTYLLKNNGELYSTGLGKLGQLGFINNKGEFPEISYVFTRIYFNFENNILDDVFIDNIFIGSDFSFALDSGKQFLYKHFKHFYKYLLEKNIYSWGWNEHYNLGNKNNKNLYTPYKIQSEDLNEVLNNGNFKIKLGGAFVIFYNPSKRKK